MIDKLIYIVAITALISCQNIKKEEEIVNHLQDFDKVHEIGVGEFEKFVFEGSLKDWIRLGSHEGYFFPLNIKDRHEGDSISGVYLEYNFGVYLMRSSKLGLNIRVPLFPELHVLNEYPCKPLEVFNYYRNEFRNNLMFKGGESYLEFGYNLVDKEKIIYQVFHNETYQPNFETAPVVTGRRIYTISLKEGVVEYESEGVFEKEWY
jgi:hypothetical protein